MESAAGLPLELFAALQVPDRPLAPLSDVADPGLAGVEFGIPFVAVLEQAAVPAYAGGQLLPPAGNTLPVTPVAPRQPGPPRSPDSVSSTPVRLVQGPTPQPATEPLPQDLTASANRALAVRVDPVGERPAPPQPTWPPPSMPQEASPARAPAAPAAPLPERQVAPLPQATAVVPDQARAPRDSAAPAVSPLRAPVPARFEPPAKGEIIESPAAAVARAAATPVPAPPHRALRALADTATQDLRPVPALDAPSVPSAQAAALQTAPAAAASPAPPAPDVPISPARLSEAVAGEIRWMVDQKQGQAKLRLHPPELGSLEIKISVVDDKTHVQMVAQLSAARDLLEQNLPRLRELLAHGGIDLGGASVSGGGEQRAGSRTTPDAQFPAPSAPAPNAETDGPPAGRDGLVDLYA